MNRMSLTILKLSKIFGEDEIAKNVLRLKILQEEKETGSDN